MVCESMKVADDYCKPCATPMSMKEGLQLVWWILSIRILIFLLELCLNMGDRSIMKEMHYVAKKEGLSAIV